MKPKTLWLALTSFCMAALVVGYLTRGKHETPAGTSKQSPSRTSAKPREVGPSGPGDTAAAIPESKRHSEDLVEKDRSEKTKLRELEKAVAEQEVKLAAARKELGNIVRTKGIIYQGPGGDYSAKENPNAKQDAQDFVKTKAAVEAEMKHLDSLKSELEKEKARLGIASPPEGK